MHKPGGSLTKVIHACNSQRWAAIFRDKLSITTSKLENIWRRNVNQNWSYIVPKTNFNVNDIFEGISVSCII